ncbi:MAG: permease-like cell division protein FtsX [Myxococcota bacterium]|nr:permease-like cell division protein FtsX [Myxococcota bacterium]
MSRLVARVLYFGRTAFVGLVASPVTTGVAVATIGICLVLVGSFALLLRNMEELLDRFGGDLHVTAYLEARLSEAARRDLVRRAGRVEGVESLRLVSEAEALERFQAGVGGGAAFLEGLGENPLPASLEITLRPAWRSAEGLREVTARLAPLGGIEDLASGQDWVEGYLRALALLRGLGIGLGVILALATLLIVANTIRLAVLARRDELEILKLVGASRSFVSTPFLLEGLLEGAAGGALALLLLLGLFRLVLPGFEFGLELLLGGVSPRFFTLPEALWLVAGGAGLGVLGSGAALSGGLRA